MRRVAFLAFVFALAGNGANDSLPSRLVTFPPRGAVASSAMLPRTQQRSQRLGRIRRGGGAELILRESGENEA
jgi:hypothetical protein